MEMLNGGEICLYNWLNLIIFTIFILESFEKKEKEKIYFHSYENRSTFKVEQKIHHSYVLSDNPSYRVK